MREIVLSNYLHLERDLFQQLFVLLNTKLLLYCTTGSFARKDIILGWSDIDILIVIKELDKDTITKIYRIILAKSILIKIGVTIYSLEEFNNYYVDPKTLDAIHFIKFGLYSPRIQDKQIKLIEPSKRLIKIVNKYSYAYYIHYFKREISLYPEIVEKKLYKLITNVFRTILRSEGIITTGYKDVWEETINMLPSARINLITPKDILHYPSLFSERYEEYFRILIILSNMKYAKI